MNPHIIVIVSLMVCPIICFIYSIVISIKKKDFLKAKRWNKIGWGLFSLQLAHSIYTIIIS